MRKPKLTLEQEQAVHAERSAGEWWRTDGQYIGIQASDEELDWYYKRDGLAKIAFIAGFKAALHD